ncbi:hypothetical protein [Natrarchaeobaculum sulfurireducens]|uniref:Uncharacterized protein n=1 Tax=Natrarchaeobaculum sulfurireducens TaxID=2044521 RepID=A0A346PMP6_9EURY|nr:hypothetical protein [Natrarchaeobaculum sulfurireducens]AXR80791.1 hypothetical protein AArcMg_0769 [Natrarchaeobaculum sulfurireducens]
MTTYRWTHSRPIRKHRDDLSTVEQGDEFEPTESELKHFSDRIEVVEDADPDESDKADETNAAPIDPSEYTIGELENELADVDDRDALIAVGKLESEQQDRDGALEAVEDRIAEIEGSED